MYQISDVVGFSQCFFDDFLYHFKEIPKSNNLKKKNRYIRQNTANANPEEVASCPYHYATKIAK